MTWMKKTEGNEDSMLTLSVVSLGVILFKFVFSEMTIGPFTMGQLDGTVIAAILTPTLAAYCARKHSDNMTSKKENTNPKEKDEESN